MKPREVVFSVLLFFSALLLFSYNLSWGKPYFFHPDERNIAYGVAGLHFPTQLNPHFFAYGSLPIYVIYVTALLKNILLHHPSFTISVDDAIMASRILSCILALATVSLLFFVGKKLHSIETGLLASFFSIFSVGFIQFAHFGTFEMWLTFFYLLLFSVFSLFLKQKTVRYYTYLLIVSGILISIKISSLVLLIIPFFALFLLLKDSKRTIWERIALLMLFPLIIGGIFLLTNPFILFDFPSFISSIQYESNVATGKQLVFYTGGFLTSTPVLYQLLRVYPFLLNPVILVVGFLSFFMNNRHKIVPVYFRLILFFFLFYFLTQAFLFVKWTRYLLPTLPFVFLSLALFLGEAKKHTHTRIHALGVRILLFLCIGSSFIWSTSYFKSVLLEQDTRIAALSFAKQHIPQNSRILTEAYDLGVLPFQSYYPNFTLFNFYDLDTNPLAKEDLLTTLKTTDYILLPSQRVIKNRLTNPYSFPISTLFYGSLNKKQLYTKIYESPCDLFCQITYLGDPVFRFEETASVFDRPTVFIYKVHDN